MDNLVTRTMKEFYKELFMQGEGRQLYQFLFPFLNVSTTESFLLDSLIQDPYGVTYRHADTQSHLRPFVNGEGQLIKIPRASEKTALSESLMAKVAVGLEADGGFGANEAAILKIIYEDHIAGHNMTKNKQALEVFEDATFSAHGVDGDSLDIKYTRKNELTFNYDFTTEGNDFSGAVAAQQEVLRTNGTPLANMVMMCGQDFLSEFADDTKSQDAAQNNALNQLVTTDMNPKIFAGVEGLFTLGQLRSRDMLAPVWLVSYEPGVPYKANKGDAGELFFPSNKAIMFSTNDRRTMVQRGIRVKGTDKKSDTVTGDIVFDEYSTDDPVTDFTRSATRHGFVPSNINHTSVMTAILE